MVPLAMPHHSPNLFARAWRPSECPSCLPGSVRRLLQHRAARSWPPEAMRVVAPGFVIFSRPEAVLFRVATPSSPQEFLAVVRAVMGLQEQEALPSVAEVGAWAPPLAAELAVTFSVAGVLPLATQGAGPLLAEEELAVGEPPSVAVAVLPYVGPCPDLSDALARASSFLLRSAAARPFQEAPARTQSVQGDPRHWPWGQ